MKKKIIGSLAIIIVVLLLIVSGIFVVLRRSNQTDGGNVLGISWYDENGTEFTITTAEELYEFAELSNYYTFVGQTVKLGADIVVNEGSAEEWAEHAPKKRWKPINAFGGTFDGQGHTISGLYMKGFDVSVAMFTETKIEATVKNFKLVNTYIETIGSSGVASISSGGGGNFKQIYSDAILNHDGMNVGGLFSRLQSQTTIEECCFAGSIKTTERTVGGIIDGIWGAHVTMSHVLFSGSVECEWDESAARAGGIVGFMRNAGATLNLSDSLSTGSVVSGNKYYTGSVIGLFYGGTAFTSTDCYMSASSYDVAIGRSGTQGELRGMPTDLLAKDLIGDKAYEWTTLDFEKYWTTVEDDTPILQCFADEIRSTAGLEKAFDTSWYNEAQSEFVLMDAKDLYGLKYLSMEHNFKGKTIKLGADIVVNEGDAKTFEKTEPENAWTSVNSFAGTFDGQGHSISGLYMNTGSEVKGLFALTTKDATVKNLKLVNSYYKYTGASNAIMGGIAGRGNGVFENIYTDVMIRTNGLITGGIIGQINVANKNRISNCWFDGEIYLEEGGRYAGGIVSNVVKGGNVMEHCLSTGTIVNETKNIGIHVGGLVGVVMNELCELNINDCLHAGTIKTAYDVCVGSVIGRITSDAKVRLQNTYATQESYTHKTDGFKAIGTVSIATESGNVIAFPKSVLEGVGAYQWTTLDFANYWAAQAKNTPVLKMFTGSSLSLAGVKKVYDISWYKENATTYTLTSKEDLYGFFLMSGITDFTGKTVKLGADITVNEGNATDWATTAPTLAWYPIPSFGGTFDGQGHTISGIYLNTASSYAGIFAKTLPESTIKNVRITNSYYNSTADMAAMGSIAGQMGGTLDTVYSNAILTSTGHSLGGLVGRINHSGTSEYKVNNCWFDGSVSVKTENQRRIYVGGISGSVVQGTLNMSNVLNTGSVTYKYDNIVYKNGKKNYPAVAVGGIFGGLANGKTLNEDGSLLRTGVCNLNGALNTGKVVVMAENDTHLWGNGGIFGYTSAKDAVINYSNVYFVKGSAIRAEHYNPDTIKLNGTSITLSEEVLSGKGGYKYTTLDFDTYWTTVVNPDSTPVLASFATSRPSVAGLPRLMDTSWYDPSAKEYTIDSVADLYGFYAIANVDNFKGKTVKLGADITINEGSAEGFESTAPENEWFPIGSIDKAFTGTFDGQGHSIKGMYIDTTSQYIGFFACTPKTAVVKNLRLEDAYVCSTTEKYPQVGSVSGLANGTFDNIYSNAIVKAEGNYAGGLFGRASTAVNISNCWYDGIMTVSGRYCGGILGAQESGVANIENSLNTGTIISTYSTTKYPYTAGILGGVCKTGTEVNIRNCFNSGILDIQGIEAGERSTVGAIVGRYDDDTIGKIENAYYTTDSALLGISNNTEGKDKDSNVKLTDSMCVGIPRCYVEGIGAYRYTDLDFGQMWSVMDGDVPVPKCFAKGMTIPSDTVKADTSWYTSDDTYQIDTVAKLYGLTKLSLNNDFAGKTIEITAAKLPVNGEWMPIGVVTAFQGTFDGKMNTISGIQVNTDIARAGLFGYAGANALIKNVKLTDSKIQSSYSEVAYVGGIVGMLDGNIDTVYTNAEIVTNGREVGGIVGRVTRNTTHTIKNAWFDGSITASGSCDKDEFACIGGVVGRVYLGQNTMENCVNTGTVTNNMESADALSCTGGIVGTIIKSPSGYKVTLIMRNCLNTGMVTAAYVNAAGSVMGRTRYPVTFINVYTSDDISCNGASPSGRNTVPGVGNHSTNGNTINGAPVVKTSAQLTGIQARYNAPFDYYTGEGSTGTWSARDGKAPGLTVFIPVSEREVKDEAIVADTTWYKSEAITYTITTVAEFVGFANLSKDNDFSGKTVKLDADITLNLGDADGWSATNAPTNAWPQIGTSAKPFKGVFNGGKHTISGVYVNATNQYAGLFAAVEGTNCEIKNLKLVNSYFTSSYGNDAAEVYLGSIAGIGNAKFENIYSSATVDAPKKNIIGGLVGGVVGWATNFNQCQYSGEINLYQYGAGYVGTLVKNTTTNTGAKVTFTNCLSTGSLTAAKDGVGGFSGNVRHKMSVELNNCVSNIAISVEKGASSAGSVISGLKNSATATINNVYTTNKVTARTGETVGYQYDNGIGTGSSGSVSGTGTTIINSNTTFALDGAIWRINDENIPELIQFLEGYKESDTSWYESNPYATEYTLTTPAEFLGFAELSKENSFEGKTIKLGAGITLNSEDSDDWATEAPSRVWQQIGSDTVPFKGVFDGGNHTISGIYINGTNTYNGLFAAVEGVDCEIKNFKLINSYITSSYVNSSASAPEAYLGSIAGRGNAKFENIYSSATVVAERGVCVGGLIGTTNAGTSNSFNQCQFAGSMNLYQFGGGILGIIENSGTAVSMMNCMSQGTLTSESHNVGGICGNVKAGTSFVIEHCVSDITMSVPSKHCAGSVISRILGTATINHVYTTNKVTARNGAEVAWMLDIGSGNNSTGTLVSSSTGSTLIDANTTYDLDTTLWTIEAGKTPCLTRFDQ